MDNSIVPTGDMMDRSVPAEIKPSGLSIRQELFARELAKIPLEETDRVRATEVFLSIPGANPKTAPHEVAQYLQNADIWKAVDAYREVYGTDLNSLKKDRHVITKKIVEAWENNTTAGEGGPPKVRTGEVLAALKDKESLFGARESERHDTKVIIQISGGDVLSQARRVNAGEVETEISDAEYEE